MKSIDRLQRETESGDEDAAYLLMEESIRRGDKALMFHAARCLGDIPLMLECTEHLGWCPRFVYVEPDIYVTKRWPEYERRISTGRTENYESFPDIEVEIEHGFFVATTPITQAQYEALAGFNPSFFSDESNRPVESLCWYDALDYCNRLSGRIGLNPVCELDDGSYVAGNHTDFSPYIGTMYPGQARRRFLHRVPGLSWLHERRCVRLPYESEWEYVARLSGDFPSEEQCVDDYSWHMDNSAGETHPVALLNPLPPGLFDLFGNVSEWCLRDTDSRVVPDKSPHCGGGWFTDSEWLFPDFRGANRPDATETHIGFRCIIAL